MLNTVNHLNKPPRWFLGSESKFAKPLACPKGAMLCIAAKLASDPNNQLPPEGAAAPAVWQSQSRGPCLQGMSTTRFYAWRVLLLLPLGEGWGEGQPGLNTRCVQVS